MAAARVTTAAPATETGRTSRRSITGGINLGRDERAPEGDAARPEPAPAAFDNPDWLFELKYDGFHALLEIDAAGARLVSRKHLDPLAAALAKRLRVTDAILDGEVICVDETGRPIFLEMLRGRHPVCFVTFDLLCQRRGLSPAAAR